MGVTEVRPELSGGFADDLDVSANRIKEKCLGNFRTPPEGLAKDQLLTAVLNVPDVAVSVFDWHGWLQRYSLDQNALAQVAKPAGRYHINFCVEQILNVGDKAGQVKKGPAGLHVYQEVNVAPVAIVASDDGSKDTDVLCAVLLAQAEDLCLLFAL